MNMEFDKRQRQGDFCSGNAAPIRIATRFALALICAFAVCDAMTFAAFAAEDGAYLAATNTYYLNPDTGVTDDGGSKNAAIGEGMCRSVIYEKALVEIEDGKIYATVRVQLVSNMGAIKFTVQQKPGDPASYASVSPRVIAEDAGADTADYRFQVPAVNSYIGCSTYVTPMGRDVKFYMNLSDDLAAGSGDFVVSVKPKAAQAEPAADDAGTAEEKAAEEAPEVETDTGYASGTPAADIDGAGSAASESGLQASEKAGESTAGAATLSESENAGGNATDETNARDIATATENESANGPNAAQAETERADKSNDGVSGGGEAQNDDGADAEPAGGGFPVIPALIAVALIVGITAAAILRKRKQQSATGGSN
jgi:hypothetical protein